MTYMTDADEEKKAKARAEWAKFQDVAELLEFVAKLDKIYDQLKKSGSVLAMGPSGDSSPNHSLALTDDSVWGSLSLQDQYTFLAHLAQRTEPHVNALIPLMQDEFGVQVNKGPMMIQGQVVERSTKVSSNDMRSVIDLFRCGMTVVVKDLAQVRNMLDRLRHGDLAKNWQVVHIQNGFENKENKNIAYGYRDIKVIAICLKTGYLVRIEFHLRSYYDLMQDQGWKHYQFTRQYPFQPVMDATQIMDMRLLPEIVDVGVEAWNSLIGRDQQHEKVDILLRLGSLKLRQVQMLSDDDKSLQKATLASKAVYYFDQAIRIDGLLNDDKSTGIATHCRLLIGLSQSLCRYDWSVYYARRYYDNVEVRVELPQILLPGMNNESIYYGIHSGVRKISAQFGERHPVTLHAKYVKLGAMLGKRACEYANELVQEERSVLGYDHPMVFETLVLRYIKIQEVWAAMAALNDIIEILKVNLDRLGIHHPAVVRLLLYLCVVFQTEKNSFCMDAPGSQTMELLRILGLPKWGAGGDGERKSKPFVLVDLVKYALTKTVRSPDRACKLLQVGARVAVWSWEYQDYWSGEIVEKKGDVIHVQYDLPGSSEWISPLRRHTLLLSHIVPDDKSCDDPQVPLVLPHHRPHESKIKIKTDEGGVKGGGVKVGDRMLLWYGFSYNSYYSVTIDSVDGNEMKVIYDSTNEYEYVYLKDDAGRYLVTTRNDQGIIEDEKEGGYLMDVEKGDNIYVYWDIHKTYWLGKVLGVAKEEEEEKETEVNKGNPTKFRIQFYSGDLHVCDLSQMKFYPESHALF